MRILLDSHIFIWAKAASKKLKDAARAAIEDPGNEVSISVASAWELWVKHAKVPITPILDGGPSAFMAAARQSKITLLEISLDHAARAATLPMHHRDPFDRLLIAQAMHEDMTLVTNDAVFDRYAGLRTLKT